MISSAKKEVHYVLKAMLEVGVRQVVISPGSRNAPLIIALDECSEIECFLVHDERSAAFMALGLSESSHNPVALLCTSGSAVLNYAPAVAEAFYRGIPLLVISADRPAEWIDHGDGQTIRQQNVLHNHVLDFLDIQEGGALKLDTEVVPFFKNLTKADKGPIHLNIGFYEPLYDTENIASLPEFSINVDPKQDPFVLEDSFKETWKKSERILILVGQLNQDLAAQQLLTELSNDTRVAVLLENTSNISNVNSFTHCIDRALASISGDELAQYVPDLLITFGGAVVSKKVKVFLRKNKPKNHWRVSFDFPKMDTYRSLSKHFKTSMVSFLRCLNQIPAVPTQSTYGFRWKQKDFLTQEDAIHVFEKIPFSDLKVYEYLNAFLPEDCELHMANSSVVRYFQLFNPLRNVRYYANRGTSGIDGSTSTAIGHAYNTQDKWNVIVSGDISFFYDSNALWNKYLKPNLRIIVLQNGGGGIFNIIPGPKETSQHKPYFVTENNYSVEGLASCFGLEYGKAENEVELEEQLQEFFTYEEDGKPKILEVFTPEALNHQILQEYFDSMKATQKITQDYKHD